MLESNNPAARLDEILKAACEFKDNQAMGGVWRELIKQLGLEMAVEDFLSEVAALSRETQKAFEQLEGFDQILLKDCIFQINRVLFHFVENSQWVDAKKYFNDKTRATLSLGASALEAIYSDRKLDEEILNEILRQVEDLSSTVQNSDLDTELKRLVLEYAEKIRLAVINFRIHGTAGLRQVAEMNLGFILTHLEDLEKPGFRETVGKLYKVTAFIFDLLDTGKTIIELIGGDISGLLPPGNGG